MVQDATYLETWRWWFVDGSCHHFCCHCIMMGGSWECIVIEVMVSLASCRCSQNECQCVT